MVESYNEEQFPLFQLLQPATPSTVSKAPGSITAPIVGLVTNNHILKVR